MKMLEILEEGLADLFTSRPKTTSIDWKKRAKELFSQGMNEQQVLQQLIKEGCPSKQAPVYVQAGQLGEGKFRSQDIEEYKPDNSALNNLKSKYLPDWEMLDHKTLQAKYVAKDHRYALKFVEFINELSEKMDHFAEVTQDVAEVTVKTTTFDVKGLTILDFQLAMRVDDYAENNDIEQVRMQGNFGMHEAWSEKYKRSINCSNPKGFSQRAHCQGRKKK